MSIKLRILLAVLALELAGYSILLNYNVGASREALGGVREAQITATLHAHVNRVAAQTGEIERSALDLAGIGEYLLGRQRDDPAGDREPALRQLLARHFERFPSAVGGGLWYEPGLFPAATPLYGPYVYRDGERIVFTWDLSTPQYDYPHQAWYLTGLPADWPRDTPRPKPVYWTAPYRDEAGTNALMMTADAPMYDADGRLVGMSTVDWSLAGIREFIASMQITPGAGAFLIDRDSGLFVECVLDPTRVMQSAAALPWARDVLAGARVGVIDHRAGIRFGSTDYGVWFTATGSGLVLGALVPDADLLGELQPVLRRNFLIGVVLSLVFVTCVTLLLNLLFRPFDRVLTQILRSVGRHDDGSLRLTPLPPRRDREFGPIIAALNDVYREVGHYTDELVAADARRAQQQREIVELNATLEQRIAERTRDLSDKNGELERTLRHLIETQQQLVEAEKHASLSRLVAGVAHEINTPVGNALTAATHLAEQADEVVEALTDKRLTSTALRAHLDAAREAAALVQRNLDRAAQLVSSFKRIAVDQSGERKRQFQLSSYIDDVVLTLRPLLKRSPHRVSVHCPRALEVDSYPGAFAQILTNLVQNALIHAFAPEQAGQIEIRVEDAGEQIVLTVADDGSGIAEADLEHVFDAFFTTNRAGGGSGLGLNIVYNLVNHSLGGTIRVENAPQGGARFVIRVPKTAPDSLPAVA